MQRFSSVLDREDRELAAGALGEVARFVALGRGDALQSLALAQAERASDLALRYMKSAAGSVSDPTWGGALDGRAEVVSAFVESLHSKSVFARLLADGMTRLPLKTKAAVLLADASAFVVGEGGAIPISALSLAGATLAQQKAAGMIVISNELVRSVSPAARVVLDNSLKAAVASALDAKFIDLISDGVTPTTASGTTAADALSDLKALLDVVNTTAAGALFFVVSTDVANAASTLAGSDGALVFPGMSPLGGEMFNLPAIASDAVQPGTLMLLDACGIAGDIETVTISLAEQATIQIDSAPNSPPNAASVMTSLWQTNRVAILARALFGAERLRDSAVAIVSDIAWGTAP